MNNYLNLFWAIVWTTIFLLAILGIFWKWAFCIIALIAAVISYVFIKEYIHFARMK